MISFNKAIEVDTNYILAFQIRVIFFTNLRCYENSIEDYNQIIQLDPYYTEAYIRRGNVFQTIGDKDNPLLDPIQHSYKLNKT